MNISPILSRSSCHIVVNPLPSGPSRVLGETCPEEKGAIQSEAKASPLSLPHFVFHEGMSGILPTISRESLAFLLDTSLRGSAESIRCLRYLCKRADFRKIYGDSIEMIEFYAEKWNNSTFLSEYQQCGDLRREFRWDFLSALYRTGFGPALGVYGEKLVEKGEREEGIKALQTALSFGYEGAYYPLGCCYEGEERLSWLKKGKEDPRCIHALAEIMQEEGDEEGALPLYRKSYQMGHYESSYPLLDLLRIRGKLGDSEALYEAGLMYLFGEGCLQSDRLAFHYLRQSVFLGNSQAIATLSELYQMGIGGPAREEKADWRGNLRSEFRRKLHAFKEVDDPIVLYNIGFYYEMGRGVAHSAEKSYLYYERAASRGLREAMPLVADQLIEWAESATDPSESLSHFRKCFQLGLEGVQSDHEEMIPYALRAAEGLVESGDREACRFLAEHHADSLKWKKLLYEWGEAQDLESIVQQFQELNQMEEGVAFLVGVAENGDRHAETFLGPLLMERGDERAFTYLERSFEEGGVKHHFLLGRCYADGRGTEKSQEKAKMHFLKAHQGGYDPALVALGDLFVDEAEKWYRLAAHAQQPEAYQKLAEILLTAPTTIQRVHEAIDWLKKAESTLGEAYRIGAELGDAECLFLKGRALGHKGLSLLLQAAKLGHRPAIEYLVCHTDMNLEELLSLKKDPGIRCYLFGKMTEQSHPEKAIEYYRKAIQGGVDLAKWRLGHLLLKGNQEEEGYTLLREAAEREVPEAQYEFGCLLRDRNSQEAYWEWWKKASEFAHPAATYELGLHGNSKELIKKGAVLGHPQAELYVADKIFSGEWQEEEYEMAEQYYLSAGKKGFVQAFCPLGMLKESNGEFKEAAHWYRRAKGDPKAEHRLGYLYLNGLGVQSSAVKALIYYNRARRSLDDAASSYAHLYERLSLEGNAKTLVKMAKLHLEGKRLPKSTTKAKELLEKAKRMGSAEAIELLT